MPMLVSILHEEIPNYYGKPGTVQRDAAQEVIKQLDYADVFRREAGTLHTSANRVMRVDMQGRIRAAPNAPERHNIQVQVNGRNLQGGTTVAHADVSQELMTDDPANQVGVARRVINALHKSLDEGRSYRVTGSIP
jgi:hypothetical protein